MSLERRFFFFLLVPVAVIVAAFGFWGFFFARAYLLDQWLVSIHLQLEKAAHEISMSLNEKLELINLIAKAEDAPDRNITQAFLIQELLKKPNPVNWILTNGWMSSGSPKVRACLKPTLT